MSGWCRLCSSGMRSRASARSCTALRMRRGSWGARTRMRAMRARRGAEVVYLSAASSTSARSAASSAGSPRPAE